MYVNVCVRVCVQMHVCAAMWGLYCHNNYVLDQQWVSGPETGGCPHMRSLVSALMFGKVRTDKSSYVFQGNSKNSRIGCLHRRCKDSLSNVATASSQTTVKTLLSVLVVSYWSSQKCQFWILSSCSGKGKHINSCADSDTHRSTFYHCPSSPMGFFYWVREFSLLPSIIHCSQWLATGDDTASSCFVLGVTDVLLGETNQTNSMVTSQACWEPIQRARAFSADEWWIGPEILG